MPVASRSCTARWTTSSATGRSNSFAEPVEDGGAKYLIGTDAAGEGVNLQFCWLMVNYDVPWNPARLEQRMGRIHRYGQKHDASTSQTLSRGRRARAKS